jgi:hypothetical protein
MDTSQRQENIWSACCRRQPFSCLTWLFTRELALEWSPGAATRIHCPSADQTECLAHHTLGLDSRRAQAISAMTTRRSLANTGLMNTPFRKSLGEEEKMLQCLLGGAPVQCCSRREAVARRRRGRVDGAPTLFGRRQPMFVTATTVKRPLVVDLRCVAFDLVARPPLHITFALLTAQHPLGLGDALGPVCTAKQRTGL